MGGAEGEGEGAALGDFAGVGEQLGGSGGESGEFGGAAEVVGALEAFIGVGLGEQGAGADALEQLPFEAVGGGGVVDAGAEDGGEGGGEGGAGGGGGAVEAAGEEFREGGIVADGEEAEGAVAELVAGEGEALAGGGAVVGSLGGAGSAEEVAEVLVADGVLDVAEEGVGADAEFGADEGLDACGAGVLGELGGAVEVAGVGEGDGGEAVAEGELDDVLGGEGAVEEGVVAAKVEGDGVEGGRGFGEIADGAGRWGWGRGGGVAGALAEAEVVAAEDDAFAVLEAEGVDGAGEAAAGGAGIWAVVEGQFALAVADVEVAQFEGDEAERDAAAPGLAEEGAEAAVEVGLEVGGFREAFAALVFGHVVVADFDGEGADAAIFGADLGHEAIGHAAEEGFEVVFVGEVDGEGFLFSEGAGGLFGEDEGAFVDAAGEVEDGGGLAAEEEFEQVEGGLGEVADVAQAGGVEAVGGFGADAGEPFVGEGVEEGEFGAWGDFDEGLRFAEFGGDLADEFAGGDALADIDFEFLADGVADGLGDFAGGALGAGEVEIAFVDAGHFDVWGEVKGVGEHPLGELFVALVVAGEDDELGAELAGAGGGHGGVDAHAASFVGSGGDDAAGLAADGDGFAAETGVGGLLYGSEEGIGVQVDDGARHGGLFFSWGGAQEHADDALDHEFAEGDKVGVEGVFGAEEGAAAVEEEGFEGALAVDEGGDDVAWFGVGVLFEDDDIAVEDVFSDHGVAGDFEGEDSAGAGDAEAVEVDVDEAVGVLGAEVGEACGDGAEEGDGGDAFGGFAGEAEGAGGAAGFFEAAFALEGVEVELDRAGAFEVEVVGDFADGGGGLALVEALAEVVEDLLLAGGERGHGAGVRYRTPVRYWAGKSSGGGGGGAREGSFGGQRG